MLFLYLSTTHQPYHSYSSDPPTHPYLPPSALLPPTAGQLSKEQAEKLFLFVMPLAQRDLYSALKHEGWAGRDLDEVRRVFVQVARCVQHLHDKGSWGWYLIGGVN